MRIKIHNQLLYTNTLIEYTVPPFLDISTDLEPILETHRSIVLDLTGGFHLRDIKNMKDIRVLLVKPSYREFLKLVKLIDFSHFSILVINTIRPMIPNNSKTKRLKSFLNKLWSIIYKHSVTVIYVNGYEKKILNSDIKYVPRFSRISNSMVSYRVLVPYFNDYSDIDSHTDTNIKTDIKAEGKHVVVQKYESE